jgi:hypothetical protein
MAVHAFKIKIVIVPTVIIKSNWTNSHFKIISCNLMNDALKTTRLHNWTTVSPLVAHGTCVLRIAKVTSPVKTNGHII